MVSLRYITSKEIIIMVEFLGGVGVGYAAIFMPVLLLFVIFYFDNKTKKDYRYTGQFSFLINLSPV